MTAAERSELDRLIVQLRHRERRAEWELFWSFGWPTAYPLCACGCGLLVRPREGGGGKPKIYAAPACQHRAINRKAKRRYTRIRLVEKSA